MTQFYDAVVVGSGPVGSAFARIFADSAQGASVLIVEAGPQISDPPGAHVRNISNEEQRAAAQKASEGPRRSDSVVDEQRGTTHVLRPGTFLISDGMTTADSTGLPAATMSTNVGGMGSHWTAACPKPGGQESIAEIPDHEMAAALDEADELLSVTQEAFSDSPLHHAIIEALAGEFPRNDAGDRPVQPMPLAVRPLPGGGLAWAGSDWILGSTLQTGAVELRANTLATSVVIDDGRATGVWLLDRASGERVLVEAGVVFVAGDSFRTPQLLFASGVRPWALGRYLNDHSDARTFVHLHEKFRGIEGRGGVSWIPYSDDGFPFHCQVMQLDTSPIGFVPSGGVWPDHAVGVVLFGTKELSPDDRVEFSDVEVDSYGMPAMTVTYTFTDRDRQAESDLIAMAGRIAGTLGTPLLEPRVLPPGGSYHVMGTVRLGADPTTSVCNPTGEVWGVSGLYVGGNGVIPTPTACNPTVTSVALAIRSARAAVAARAA